MRLQPVLVSPPGAAPVSLEEMKKHCRVVDGDEDDLIGSYIEAAVSHLDGWSGILGRCIVSQSWRQGFKCWPADRLLRLPFTDVTEITSITYVDADGADQTADPSLYGFEKDAVSAVIWFKKAFSPPALSDDEFAPVRVTFVAGFGEADDVPAGIKHAIKLLVGHWYENRESTIVGQIEVRELPMAVNALLTPWRRVGL